VSSRADEHFSSDYAEARERFRVAAKSCGARLEAHPLAVRSSGGEELTVDTAYLGPESPGRVLVVSSGLHGAEGFAGSAIQHRLLRDQLPGRDPEPGCGFLLVHALNPYGFDCLRRVNENNVDLNRNFVSHPGGHVVNESYDALYDAINPVRLDEEEQAKSDAALGEFARQHGFDGLQAALSIGQYVHAEGIMFGGDRPEESNLLLRRIAPEATRGAEQVVWIDVHTGLGPWGEVELISESPVESAGYRRARAWWGERVGSTVSKESVSAQVHGSIAAGLGDALPGRELTVVGAEFGTHDPVRVFRALRADNWLHAHGEPDSEQGAAIKLELKEVFQPEEPKWGARILEIGAELIANARGAR
jgi:hypothetical protein